MSVSPVWAAAPAAPSPSFDCKAARLPYEKRVCADAQLATLDRELAAAFQALRKLLPEQMRPDLEAAQREWAASRGQCEGAAEEVLACLRTSYEKRLQALRRHAEAARSQPGKRATTECTKLVANATGLTFEGIEVGPKLPKYTLVAVPLTKGDSTRIHRVEIGPAGQPGQVIDAATEGYADPALDGFEVLQCDANFDGFNDLLLFGSKGVPANLYYSLLVFVPATKRFHIVETFIGMPSLDESMRLLIGGYTHSNGRGSVTTTYRVRGVSSSSVDSCQAGGCD
ncbi:MAG TPA: lysozyme inhibitor LprI family protein [Myxococcales bacterium]